MARQVLVELYERALEGLDVGRGDVEGAIRMAMSPVAVAKGASEVAAIRTRRKTVTARSPGQKIYLEAIAASELVFGVGPAGTGKTYLAVVCAAAELMAGRVDRIILSRPAVEAGERLGFLPGDMKEKVDPYLRPLYDALYDVMPPEAVIKGLADNTIEIAPLAFMRGRTLSSAFIILDEAQNTTPQQMKMFLTRLGEGSRMVITGDPTQVDLPPGTTSGLTQALDYLKGVKGISQVKFDKSDIVRHQLVSRIVDAYERAGWEPATRPRTP
jgi:phosphate starvation-inducible PhoH-like protein